MTLSRRHFLASTSAFALAGTTVGASASTTEQAFDHGRVIALAQELAAGDYTPRDSVPEVWQNLTYEQYKLIRFLPEAALWYGTDTPFNVDFFTPGLYFPQPIKVDTVENGVATPSPLIWTCLKNQTACRICRWMTRSGFRACACAPKCTAPA